jgi:hypothetical protein
MLSKLVLARRLLANWRRQLAQAKIFLNGKDGIIANGWWD